MKKRPGLLLNSLTHAGSRILGSICALLLTYLIARNSVEDLGVFGTVFTYFLICEFIPLLGMQTYLFREISQNPEQVKRYGFHALVFAIGMCLLTIVAVSIISALGIYSPAISQGLLIVAVGLPATGASVVGLSILIGSGKTTTFSLIQGIESLARTGVGIVFVLIGWGVMPAIIAMVAARWLSLVAYWRSIKPLLSEKREAFDSKFFRDFLSKVPTFAGITILALVLRFGTPVAIPLILDDIAAGQFRAAYVFIDLALLVPTALTTNLVPILSRTAKDNPENLVHSCRMAVRIMALGIMPVGAIIAGVARPLFTTVFPGDESYLLSASVLQIAIWTCCLQAIDQVLSATLISKGKQEVDLQSLLVGSSSLVILLVILMPIMGVMGAAYALLGGVSILVGTRFYLTAKTVGFINPITVFWRPIIGAACALYTATLVASLHWTVASAIAGVAYLGALLALGTFRLAEREKILAFVKGQQ